MRNLIVTISFALTLPVGVFAYTSPGKPVGLVNDFAHILSVDQSVAIGQKLLALNKSTGAEVAVVTVSSLGGDTIENYAVKLFEEWKIGQKGKDNGLLILVAPNDRQARIEVGYGLEGTVTDLQAGNIVRNTMIPAFKDGDYAGGISGAVDAVSGLIAGDPSIVSAYSSQTSTSRSSGGSSGGVSVSVIFFAVVILNVLARILGRTKSWWLGGALGATIGTVIGFIWGFVFIGFGAIVILTILGLIFDYLVSKHPPRSGGGFWPMFFGGGHGGSGFGGGFGGFGGGGSGGGGASGRW